MSVSVSGVVVMVLFYLLVLATGIWASKKKRKMQGKSQSDLMVITLLGNRTIPLVVGIFTMAATVIGGGFIVGLSETIYSPDFGLAWATILFATPLCLLIGGLFFAKTMRERKYMTIMEPFQLKYGKAISGVLSVALILTEIFWVPSTLIGLGASMSVVLDLSYSLCVWISAAVAIIYTLLGGLLSVAYTDVVQLTLLFFALWTCVPSLLMSPYSADIFTSAFNFTYQAPWVGSIDSITAWIWIDQTLLLALGSLGCQGYHQRILSASSPAAARIISLTAAPISLIFSIPSVLIGAVAASTDWNQTEYGSPSPYERGEASLILPIALQHLTPNYISIVGIAAVAAAVMSSMDSILLSAVSIFVTNIYQNVRRASERELQWVMRISVVGVGLIGTSLTSLKGSIISFWILGATITYVFMFPQLICILFVDISNGYGAITGLGIALVLRVLAGEPSLGMPVILRLPGCTLENGVYVQYAPVSTICMLCNFFSTLLVSYMTSLLFTKGVIPERFDIYKVKSPQVARVISNTTEKEKAHQIPLAESEHETMLVLA
ncbi:high-affinity choline transporter 1-like [Nerophis ophidion]|uniref:high-affinity choline transporter 1-like n=1 Tax=Nerophis ophidion TaxID=159077 RepID=UPI002ADF531C|nr:high-affinity choline transporter 1-like [Nerophis ophidion]XP_061756134.1 high-affinity choline transporter 1-like [Nerophis ophidion]